MSKTSYTPERLRQMAIRATLEPAGKGPEFSDQWECFGKADDWLAERAPQIAELLADVWSHLILLPDCGGRDLPERQKLRTRLEALFDDSGF